MYSPVLAFKRNCTTFKIWVRHIFYPFLCFLYFSSIGEITLIYHDTYYSSYVLVDILMFFFIHACYSCIFMVYGGHSFKKLVWSINGLGVILSAHFFFKKKKWCSLVSIPFWEYIILMLSSILRLGSLNMYCEFDSTHFTLLNRCSCLC